MSEKCHKKVEFRAEKPGDLVYFDMSSIQYKSLGGFKFWQFFVDNMPDMRKVFF